VLQGTEPVTGRLWGGCLEVLEFLKGTAFWPKPDFWDDTVLFLETSEEKPPPRWVGYFLRNYGLQGILSRLRALLIGRPKDYSASEVEQLRRIVKTVVSRDFGVPELPVIMDVDFGHTDPKLILPLGVRIEVDPTAPGLRLTESPFV
jgi:muramoyltetrapeptide carboxypeptidase LdcA involved in peptidoglycan recycling